MKKGNGRLKRLVLNTNNNKLRPSCEKTDVKIQSRKNIIKGKSKNLTEHMEFTIKIF